MPTAKKDIIYEAGIDYITATTTHKKTDSSLDSFGYFLVRHDALGGAKVRNWHWNRYRGLTTGAVAVGRRHDGAIVRLSNAFAAEHWAQVTHLAENVSRLDLQVTVTSELPSPQRLKRHYQQVKRFCATRGRPAKYHMHVGPQGVETLALGKRISDRWGRCYDKGLESGLARYQNCVRYELELKRRQALWMAQQLDASGDTQQQLINEVFSFIRNRGLKLTLDYTGAGIPSNRFLIANDRSIRGDEHARSGTWIRNCVQPTVERLVRAGLLESVIADLGLTNYVNITPTKGSESLGDSLTDKQTLWLH